MAASIDNWFADRADGSDGPGDNEHVERQAAWDIGRSGRPLGQPAASARKGPSGRRANAVSLTPEQRQLKPYVTAMRKRYPGLSYKQLSELLRIDGTSLSRAQIAAILAAPARKVPSRATPPRPAPRRQNDAPRSRPTTPASTESERILQLAAAAQRAAKKMIADEKQAKALANPPGSRVKGRKTRKKGAEPEPTQRELRAKRERHRPLPPLPPPPVAPVPQAPRARLSLDTPSRKRVKTQGWTRATGAVGEPVVVRAPGEVPIPCFACGVVPTQFGSCRCT